MKNIIRKILKEDQRERYLNKIVKVMKNDYPLFKNLKDYGFWEELSEDELIYVLFEIFDGSVTINKMSYGFNIYDENNKLIYEEYSDGYWVKYEYDENGNKIHEENSDGYWVKYEYDENGNLIYKEWDDGFWKKWGYDNRGNRIYYEDSTGYIEDDR
jgi:YD repeat-containing protein